MILNEALEGRSLKSTQVMQMGSLLLIAVAASLIVAFRWHNGLPVSIALAIGAVLLPVVYFTARRKVDQLRQRETEAQLLVHTRAFLQQEEPLRLVETAPCAGESDIEILARTIDGARLQEQDFRLFYGIAPPAPEGFPVVFDALPRRYAVRSSYERRFADLAAALPRPVALPLREILPPIPPAEEFGSCDAPAAHLEIEYSNALLDEIRLRAAEGYQRMRHGGVEVGGVLFGTRNGDSLRILAVRPIECEYLSGPRFALSSRDEAGLAELLATAGNDPALAGMEPLGYYHSHTREEICLSEGDVQFFDRFFPQPWQVALVVHPSNLQPTRAGFFVRDADGRLQAGTAAREFQLS